MIPMIVMVLTKLHIDRIPEGIVEKWVKDIHLPQRTTQKKKKKKNQKVLAEILQIQKSKKKIFGITQVVKIRWLTSKVELVHA